MDEKKQMTYGDLKEALKKMEALNLTDETKVFLDTGWDSIQEIDFDSLAVDQAQVFQIEDPLNGEIFEGYSLLENAEKNNASGPAETVIVLKHIY